MFSTRKKHTAPAPSSREILVVDPGMGRPRQILLNLVPGSAWYMADTLWWLAVGLTALLPLGVLRHNLVIFDLSVLALPATAALTAVAEKVTRDHRISRRDLSVASGAVAGNRRAVALVALQWGSQLRVLSLLCPPQVVDELEEEFFDACRRYVTATRALGETTGNNEAAQELYQRYLARARAAYADMCDLVSRSAALTSTTQVTKPVLVSIN